MPFEEQQESSLMAHLLIWSVIVYMVAVFIRSVIL
jgi:ATP-binding cassette subfamily C (CFTR/MRP) protein 4